MHCMQTTVNQTIFQYYNTMGGCAFLKISYSIAGALLDMEIL